MTLEEFYKIIPDYLKETADDIHARAIKNLPDGISTIEGDLPWIATRPFAMEILRFNKVMLMNVIKLGTVQFASGKFLELKGEAEGVFRKEGSAAVQKIEVKAIPGTKISAGRIVCTEGTEEEKTVEFIVNDTLTIDSTGIGTVEAECTQIGIIGNVAPGNIKMLSKPIAGVVSVSNIEIIKDGVNEEDDESYSKRIIENSSNTPGSGNCAHFEKWAKEYVGIEDAKVISCWNGNNTVKVVLVATGHKATTSELTQEVHNYIDPYPGQGKGQAPIGTELTTVSCIERPININARLELMEGYTVAKCVEEFKEQIASYLKKLPFKTTKHISIARIGNIILNIPGVIDYSDLLINGSDRNYSLSEEELAVAGSVEME